MHRICLVAAAVLGFGAVAVAGRGAEAATTAGTDQPATPAVPPASGTSSSDLSRSGGVITPPRRGRSRNEADPALHPGRRCR